ncbi:MAG: TIGR04376 family protein, partial [Synechococcales bacterium]|nr:TIGR04376 family protein [Synechococcales bacterium]
MGLFDDFSKFLENQIDEFLKNNPHLELQAMEEKLYQQERETTNLLANLRSRLQTVEQQIGETAQEVKRWHLRIEKAKAANRPDLLQPAQTHQGSLIREGNQQWGQMEILRDRIRQSEDLQKKIQVRRKEVQSQLEQVRVTRAAQQAASPSATANSAWSSAWSSPGSSTGRAPGAAIPRPGAEPSDPLEQKFQRFEAEQELQDLKRKMGRS